jgi:hypothetical protein
VPVPVPVPLPTWRRTAGRGLAQREGRTVERPCVPLPLLCTTAQATRLWSTPSGPHTMTQYGGRVILKDSVRTTISRMQLQEPAVRQGEQPQRRLAHELLGVRLGDIGPGPVPAQRIATAGLGRVRTSMKGEPTVACQHAPHRHDDLQVPTSAVTKMKRSEDIDAQS